MRTARDTGLVVRSEQITHAKWRRSTIRLNPRQSTFVMDNIVTATIHAPKRKTPILAFFAAISLLVSPVAITIAKAHGGDSSLVHACVGRDKLMRAVGPSKRCKRSEKAIHWEIAKPNSLSGLTVVDATGRPVGQTVEVEAEEVTVLLTVGGREVELEVSPNGFTDVEGVRGYPETRGLPTESPYFVYPDSLDCSSTPHEHRRRFPTTFLPFAYASVISEYNSNGGIPDAQKLFFADPQTPPRVLSVGAVYSEFRFEAGVDGNDACVQRTIEPGDDALELVPVHLLGDLNTFGFVTPFRLQ
ncbi:MAG: hypothetical protein ACT4QB_24175 [Gammaproteobacteria bacterium]